MNHMEIKLKNIYVNERLSRETMEFQATLYIDGHKVGVITNDGQGGATMFRPRDDRGVALIREAEVWCRRLPPMTSPDVMINDKAVTVPMELEIYLDNLVTAWLDEQDRDRFRKKMEKEMLTAILFGVPGKTFRLLKYRNPIAAMIRFNKGVEQLRQDIHKKVMPLLQRNEKILNTNIPVGIIRLLEVPDEKWVEQVRDK
jgi:hypothetical protein